MRTKQIIKQFFFIIFFEKCVQITLARIKSASFRSAVDILHTLQVAMMKFFSAPLFTCAVHFRFMGSAKSTTIFIAHI